MTQPALGYATDIHRVSEPKPARFPSTLVCFSHVRWDFVHQRPQHLMSRFARDTSVFIIEEPLFDGDIAQYIINHKLPNLHVMVPHLPAETQPDEVDFLLRNLLNGFLATRSLRDTAFWYYTPSALAYTSRFNPAITIFDCMDESSALCGAAPVRGCPSEANSISSSPRFGGCGGAARP